MNAKVLQNNIVIFPFISFGVEETKMFSITILLATDSWINSAIPYHHYETRNLTLFQLYLKTK